MLELKNIKKTYITAGNKVHALKNINITFRKNEFVSILGPSGCGKTTLLNIIGGLDKYTSGDLNINGTSTKKFKDSNWDSYRNHSIGFVFQNYNLIPHQTILENVMLSLKLNGKSNSKTNKRLAKKALTNVGLSDKLNYKPNQLSGGQCQRVAIARALVNDPDIILADEPTGALDSKTSVQVMELLKEISKEKLVIMVTHNPELANKYSTRIINIKDGIIEGDTNPISSKDIKKIEKNTRNNKSYMPSKVSFMLSLKNLLSKKRRTFITCLAGSIGIIGIATILSVSSGMSNYVNKIEEDSTSFNYLIIQDNYHDMNAMMNMTKKDDKLKEYPKEKVIHSYDDNISSAVTKQNLSNEYVDYLNNNTKDLVVDIQYKYDVEMNLVSKNNDEYKKIQTTNFTEILNNEKYISNCYDTLKTTLNNKSGIPTEYNEIAIIVDKYNRISKSTMDMLGIDSNNNKLTYDDILGKEIRLINNNDYYINKNGLYVKVSSNDELGNAYSNGIPLKVVSILRAKEDASNEWLLSGIAYTKSLTDYILESNKESEVVKAQLNNQNMDVTTGLYFKDENSNSSDMQAYFMNNYTTTYNERLSSLGAVKTPSTITIYPKNYDSKDEILEVLNQWNNNNKDNQIKYTDISSIMISMLDSMINIVSYVLIAFSSISLVVSSIMIAIVIYNSVIERTKEIGILRSLGARKKDISRVFKAEAIIMGGISGIVAIIITYIICIIINHVLGNLINVTTIANLNTKIIFEMILLSIILTFIASLIPAKMAAKKDPVESLRTE